MYFYSENGWIHQNEGQHCENGAACSCQEANEMCSKTDVWLLHLAEQTYKWDMKLDKNSQQ